MVWGLRSTVSWAAIFLLGASALAQEYERDLPLTHPAIPYEGAHFDDPVARLAAAVDTGALRLEAGAGETTLLPAVLRELDVPVESQVLVFAKNSLQRAHISPRTPRALYFGDDVYVGYVPDGDVLELAGVDPIRGAAFYTLEATAGGSPRFERPGLCLACHRGAATLGVPGVYVSSVRTTPSGRPEFSLGSTVTDHRSPFESRWSGWYVDGAPISIPHLGNAASSGPAGSASATLLSPGSGLPTLPRAVSRDRYLAPGSDVVALMVLEHQTQMSNYLTRLGWEARIASAEGWGVEAVGERIAEVARYMLFVDEPPLAAPVETTGFAATFAAKGPRDASGRSLRDLDLETRLFRYPLSFMVDGRSFDALPRPVRDELYRVLYDELTRGEASRRDGEAARAAIEILRGTRDEPPAGWR